MEIENGAIILVADGEKYLLLKNLGDEKFPNLTTISHEHIANPAAHDQASDRAGRRHAGRNQGGGPRGTTGKSAMEQTDWHKVAKHDFIGHVADVLNGIADRIEHLVIVAGPTTVGELRDALSDKIRAKVTAEVEKDLTNHPIAKIEAILAAR